METYSPMFLSWCESYAQEVVSHSGREHAYLRLKGWWMAVPNTSVKNFTVTGDVD
jgi:hypothetical protein